MSIFFFHLFINIGMVLGLTPVIGITPSLLQLRRIFAVGIYDPAVCLSPD